MYYVARRKHPNRLQTIVAVWTRAQYPEQERATEADPAVVAYLESTPVSKLLCRQIGITIDDLRQAVAGAPGAMYVDYKDGRITAAYDQPQRQGQTMLPADSSELQDFLSNPDAAGAENELYDVRWSESAKWRVIRRKDQAAVQEGIGTKPEAAAIAAQMETADLLAARKVVRHA